MIQIDHTAFRTQGGIHVKRTVTPIQMDTALDEALFALDRHKGAVFASGYEYPGRYSRWDLAFVDPPLELTSRGRTFRIRALNPRGEQLLRVVQAPVERCPTVEDVRCKGDAIEGAIAAMPQSFPEEERSKQPTIFSVLRTLVQLFRYDEEPHLGLYGAFGYDLVLQFEPLKLRHERPDHQRDLHLFLPDRLFVVDHRKEYAEMREFEFLAPNCDTRGLPRSGEVVEPTVGQASEVTCDHAPGDYAKKVESIRQGCIQGDFFEVVLSQVFSAGYPGLPTELFTSIRERNPSPYEFLINFGCEQLIGASPEMFVRVDGARVETCPISGTVKRGASPIEDAKQILTLLNSTKDESELTMCTDVDRNDKSRVCVPGSVQVISRRTIETYSKLFHTVDHVVGELREGFDAFDALLSHMWACTLTGSPKPAAMQKIEDLEKSARGWYGGSVGFLSFTGNLNTGITIRTVHLRDGVASVRVGATLLADSDPEEEDQETKTKASAFINAVLGRSALSTAGPPISHAIGVGKKILFVDNNDSFVHTLGNYVRQTGAEVVTYRAGFDYQVLDERRPDLVFISPGPGRPSDFGVPDLVGACVARQLPVFGVCLGMQGIAEHFGGKLKLLHYPVHGKPSKILNTGKGIMAGLPESFEAGRYHSICVAPESLPPCLEVLAQTEDGVVMALQHQKLPAAAVQFHPESILTLEGDWGLKLIENVVRVMCPD